MPAREAFKWYEKMKLTPKDSVRVLDIIRLNAVMTATADTANRTFQSAVCNKATDCGNYDEHLTRNYVNDTI